MILWVAGGRDYTNVQVMTGAMRPFAVPGNVLITGAARGADLTAQEIWRQRFMLPYVGLPADWAKGRGAGYNRNQAIATGFLGLVPDWLLAFPGGSGTQNALDLAHGYGIEVIYGAR